MKSFVGISVAASIVGSLIAIAVSGDQPPDRPTCTTSVTPVEIRLDSQRHVHILDHIHDAIRAGQPASLHIARRLAASHRRASLAGIPTKHGYDRDEYPPAFSLEGGRGADVRYVKSSENRSAGKIMGNQTARFCDGQPFSFR